MTFKRSLFNTTSRKKIIIILLILFSFVSLNSHHHIFSHNNFDNNNPFLDIFQLYFNYKPRKAKKLLKKQFNNPILRNRSYLNYGLIQEYEKRYRQAEIYYKKALLCGEDLAFTYLLNLYRKTNSSKYLKLLNTTKMSKMNYWIDYEKAVYFLKHRDMKNGEKHILRAINKGFCSTTLLKKDPVFNQLKDTVLFQRLIRKIKKNCHKKKSLLDELKADEYLYKKDKPYGITNKLRIAVYLEEKGRDKRAEAVLLSILKSRISFRDRSISLFKIARIKAKNSEFSSARSYLKKFADHIRSNEMDKTGYRELIAPIYMDIIKNDKFLKKLSATMNGP